MTGETMRAYVIEAAGRAAVREVPVPHPAPGQVVVQVERAGICGTDIEFLTGTMPYLHDGSARYPLRPGHEWSGRVLEVGPAADPALVGAHVTGDTMIGCGRCRRCLAGHHHVCADRYEIGIRGGWHGALAERLLVPVIALRQLPDDMSPGVAAFVEPAGNAWRAVAAASLRPGNRVCVWGPGTIGLLVLQFCLDAGASVDVIGPRPESRELAGRLGAAATFHPDEAPRDGYEAVIDASTAPDVPARAVEQVEPGGRVVLVGLADRPSLLDTRRAVLRDVKVTGILAASAGLDPAIAALAEGRVRPASLISQVVSLEELARLLAGGELPTSPMAPGAPKVQVDPAPGATSVVAPDEVAGSHPVQPAQINGGAA